MTPNNYQLIQGFQDVLPYLTKTEHAESRHVLRGLNWRKTNEWDLHREDSSDTVSLKRNK